MSLKHVVATDGADSFTIKGAFWGGETFNANTLGGQGTFTDKFQIIKQGEGPVGVVNITGHFSPNGDFIFFDFGNCESPGE